MIWQETKAAHGGNIVTAAIHVGRGLMADEPEKFKRGYSADNAYLAVLGLAEGDGDTFTEPQKNTIKLALADDKGGAP